MGDVVAYPAVDAEQVEDRGSHNVDGKIGSAERADLGDPVQQRPVERPVKAVVLESCSGISFLLRGPSVVDLTRAAPTGGDRCGRRRAVARRVGQWEGIAPHAVGPRRADFADALDTGQIQGLVENTGGRVLGFLKDRAFGVDHDAASSADRAGGVHTHRKDLVNNGIGACQHEFLWPVRSCRLCSPRPRCLRSPPRCVSRQVDILAAGCGDAPGMEPDRSLLTCCARPVEFHLGPGGNDM